MVAGNWKMNKNLLEALTLASQVITKAKKMSDKVEIILAPPYPYLHTINSMAKDVPHVKIAAQNCHGQKSGAFTGEVSAEMLQSMNLSYVILGHSERRKYFDETHQVLSQKVSTALESGLNIIFCCGEPLEIREKNLHQDFVKNQLKESLFHLNSEQFTKITIAYEPIWAIGTGQTASPEQAQDMHCFIRSCIAAQFDASVAQNCTILYGGSCNPGNASALFANEDVDGGLVGGASLKAEQFLQIVQARLS